MPRILRETGKTSRDRMFIRRGARYEPMLTGLIQMPFSMLASCLGAIRQFAGGAFDLQSINGGGTSSPGNSCKSGILAVSPLWEAGQHGGWPSTVMANWTPFLALSPLRFSAAKYVFCFLFRLWLYEERERYRRFVVLVGSFWAKAVTRVDNRLSTFQR